ncbi:MULTISPECIES: cupin domain-containing protein [Microbispora]|uniref:(S)-ureidoglycine aminohydrolase cupin domain-containing protein n=1 Tax=Microbispora siamensis TaxID=564413 RepID=A0ABQ4H158_9ACTN|nr:MULTISPECIES: cupin domain-containing protein [Microbispora]OPG05365.1 hypothetical protein B1L11_35445 [Microbispora sp. GKU 823]GIH67430.1 hypothetical protein Msi02_82470 [Microbispora siamensis]
MNRHDRSFTGTPRVVRAAALADADLDPDPLDPAQVVSGAPEVRHLELASGTDLAVGVWQHGPGVSTDTEADEVFVVLGGSATIEVEGGPVLDVGPGDVVLMPGGARTVWTVHETLRKVYAVRP